MPVDPSSTSVDLSKAPAADFSFDDLFPAEGEPTPSQPQAAPESATTSEPQATPPAEKKVFLKTPTGTVYESEEEAIRGLAHKDEVIERLRQAEIARTGTDPLTGKPVAKEPQAPQSYMQDGKRYYQDLVSAIQKNDENAYAQVQAKFVYEALSPFAPILADVARQKAVRQVSTEIKDFATFQESKDYSDTLEAIPSLKQAITYAESDPAQAAQLNELYKLAYYAGQGRKVPEIVRSAVQQTPPVTTPQVTRPTTTTSTMTPPPTSNAQSNDWAHNREARKQLIADMEARGIGDKVF